MVKQCGILKYIAEILHILMTTVKGKGIYAVFYYLEQGLPLHGNSFKVFSYMRLKIV